MLNANTSVKLLTLILLLSSCTTMYRAPMQHVPMFSEKNEVQVSASIRNASLSYSPTRHLGIVASGYYRNRNINNLDDGKTSNYKGYQHALSLAVGYYKVLSFGSFEVFGGYGRGFSSLTYNQSSDPDLYGGHAHYKQYFIQPSLILGKKNFGFAFSNRVSFVNFYDFNDARQVALPSNTTGFFEPAFTIRAHAGGLGFKGQIQASIPMDDFGDAFLYYEPYSGLILITGAVELHVTELFQRKKK